MQKKEYTVPTVEITELFDDIILVSGDDESGWSGLILVIQDNGPEW